MIDLHCHILPGVDDGAQTLEDSLAMAEVAVANGITHILCTPHHNNGRFENPKYEVMKHVSKLQEELDKRDIPLTLFEGQEVRLTGETIPDLLADRLLTVDSEDKYLLIEFPSSDVPSFSEKVIFELVSKGITPIIVHPERNAVFLKDSNLLLPFLEMGCLAQLTAPSYLGVFGKKIKKMAKYMLKNNMVHMVATDAHNINKRTFLLKQAYDEIEKDFGKQKVVLLKQVSRCLINGENINFEEEVSMENPGLLRKILGNRKNV